MEHEAAMALDEREATRREVVSILDQAASAGLTVRAAVAEFADAAHVAESTIYRWKSGDTPTRSLIPAARLGIAKMQRKYGFS